MAETVRVEVLPAVKPETVYPALPFKQLVRQAAPLLVLTTGAAAAGGWYGGKIYGKMTAYKWYGVLGIAIVIYGAYKYGQKTALNPTQPSEVFKTVEEKKKGVEAVYDAIGKLFGTKTETASTASGSRPGAEEEER